MSGRPEPWENPDPARLRFEAVPQDDLWVTPSVGAGRCRAARGTCDAPPVASLMRTQRCKSGPRPVAWDYCARHLYGRWVEDGKVMGWRLVEING